MFGPIGFPRTSLAIGKNAAVKAFEDMLDCWEGHLLVHFLLVCVRVKDFIKLKLVRYFGLSREEKVMGVLLRGHIG